MLNRAQVQVVFKCNRFLFGESRPFGTVFLGGKQVGQILVAHAR